jgi:hypothetical protein
MRAFVLAVFDTPTRADTAIEDLEVARIPTVRVQREAHSDTRGPSEANWHRSGSAWQRPLVRVAVDYINADAVTEILGQYGPVKVEEYAGEDRRH